MAESIGDRCLTVFSRPPPGWNAQIRCGPRYVQLKRLSRECTFLRFGGRLESKFFPQVNRLIDAELANGPAILFSDYSTNTDAIFFDGWVGCRTAPPHIRNVCWTSDKILRMGMSVIAMSRSTSTLCTSLDDLHERIRAAIPEPDMHAIPGSLRLSGSTPRVARRTA